MSEHTPLTEDEIARLLPDLLVAEYGEDRANWTELGSVKRIAKALAARTSTATADEQALRRAVVRETNLGLDDFRMGRASNDALASRMLDAIRPFLATADTGLRERVEDATTRAVNSAYGTDERHRMLAQAVAAEVFDGTPWPWSLSAQFGQRATPASTEDERDPKACPRCGETCKYDGWGHTHPNGIGIGSCASTDPVRILCQRCGRVHFPACSVPEDRVEEALVSALERTQANFIAAVNGKPVRDMAETLAENLAALEAATRVRRERAFGHASESDKTNERGE